MTDPHLKHYARLAYEAYAAYYNSIGNTQPPWEDLGTHAQRAHYDAARAVRNATLNGRKP